jgi:hypothetical protein
MSGRVILKGSDLMLSAERAAGAPEAMYAAECMTCPAESAWVDNDPRPVEVWALEHARHSGLTHSQFLVTTQKHWRVDRVHTAASGAAPRPGGEVVSSAGAPAGPRGRSLRRLVARVGRLSGVLVLAALLFGSVVFGVLPGAGRGQVIDDP